MTNKNEKKRLIDALNRVSNIISKNTVKEYIAVIRKTQTKTKNICIFKQLDMALKKQQY